MNGTNSIGAANTTQNQIQNQPPEQTHSRRPGTANHPGKHLGQFKHKQAQMDTDATMPLVQQQLNALNTQGGNKAAKAGNQTSQQDAYSQMIMNDLINTNNNMLDEMKFMSRFSAISKAF